MAFHFERKTNGKEENSNGNESALHRAFDYAKERIKIALEAHTVLSEDTKRAVTESLDKMSVHDFMSDALDRSLASRYDGKDDEQKATQWLTNAIADDIMPRFAQNSDRYADSKQANILLTFLRGVLHRQSM